MQKYNQMREYLEEWKKLDSNGKVDEMAESFPNCICEFASKSTNGFGPVSNDEKLRYLASSRSDIDLKRTPHKSITPRIFSRIFTKGMSTIRLKYASHSEIDTTIREKYENQVRQFGQYGGVMGVVDFAADLVRNLDEYDYQVCCVLETPINEKVSHADIVISKADTCHLKRLEIRNELFKNIGGLNAFKSASDVDDCDVTKYLPRIYGGQD